MTDVDDLLNRFRALTGKQPAVESESVDVEGFLADTRDQATPEKGEDDDERDIRDGIRLSGLVRASSGQVRDRKSGSEGDAAEDETEEQDDDDELNEDEVLRRALDEAAVERDQTSSDGDPHSRGVIEVETDDNDQLQQASLFPTLPTHIPEPDLEPEAELDPIFARLQSLNASTAAPVAKSAPGPGPGAPAKAFNYSLPGFDLSKDDDLTSWCCICNQDGEIQCLTCDDDVYCAECFASSHGTGPGQERGHRFKRYQP